MEDRKIKISKTYDVICQRCGWSLCKQYHIDSFINAKEAKSFALQEGFRSVDGKTLCSHCRVLVAHGY